MAIESTVGATSPDDPFDLGRFVTAQCGVWPQVQDELATGAKTRHWMWFVFPQLAVLGRSSMARYYGLASLAEAMAYAQHPLLGARLRVACGLLAGVHGRSIHQILGSPDDLKLRSCLTLFERAVPDEPLFTALIDRYYGGQRDALTLQALADGAAGADAGDGR